MKRMWFTLCCLVFPSVAYANDGGSVGTWQNLLNIVNGILQFINTFWSFIWSALTWVFDALLWLLSQFVVLLFTGFFWTTIALVSSLDFSVLATNAAASWAGLDGNITAGVVAIGIPQGLQILLSAITIRMLLNLIPAAFTRI